MPKLKTKSSAKKRFKVTKSGKVKVKQAYARHMMLNKPKSMKRKARGMTTLCAADARLVLRNFMPWNRKTSGSGSGNSSSNSSDNGNNGKNAKAATKKTQGGA